MQYIYIAVACKGSPQSQSKQRAPGPNHKWAPKLQGHCFPSKLSMNEVCYFQKAPPDAHPPEPPALGDFEQQRFQEEVRGSCPKVTDFRNHTPKK